MKIVSIIPHFFLGKISKKDKKTLLLSLRICKTLLPTSDYSKSPGLRSIAIVFFYLEFSLPSIQVDMHNMPTRGIQPRFYLLYTFSYGIFTAFAINSPNLPTKKGTGSIVH